MEGKTRSPRRLESLWRVAVLVGLFLAVRDLPAATESKKVPVAPKWSVFEETFRSSVDYSNALQDATLQVLFTSPQGQTNQVYGFWDGGRTWRVRFAPDVLGTWTFRTVCSDPSNQGLHGRSGTFLCTPPVGESRLGTHGPIEVARDGRHLQYADGTPFFWMADTTWDGARLSDKLDWQIYTVARDYQRFTVAAWTVAPGADSKGESALTGFNDHIGVNPDFFQRLDAKIQFMSHVGLVSAIVPFWEAEFDKAAGLALPDDQIALFLRYVCARWGAEPVVWLLPFDAASPLNQAQRWKKIGHAVFGEGRHNPVLAYVGTTPGVAETFRDQPWVTLFGYQGQVAPATTSQPDQIETALQKVTTNGFAHPLIPFVFSETGAPAQPRQMLSADQVRHTAYWNLFSGPPTGLAYETRAIADWDLATLSADSDVPQWRRALFMPAARQMTFLSELMQAVDFASLAPAPDLLQHEPKGTPKGALDLALASPAKDLVIVYLGEPRLLDLPQQVVPHGSRAIWFNPRTGESSPAGAVVVQQNCRFSPPGPGDWVLILKGGA